MAFRPIRVFSLLPALSMNAMFETGLAAASRFLPAVAAALFASAASWAAAAPASVDDEKYLDILDMRGAPKTAADRSFNIFFDNGAWHGYSLPPASDGGTGFSGPFVHSLGEGKWVEVSQVFITRLKEQRYPTRAELDAAAPNNPVIFSTGPDASLNTLANSSVLRRDEQ